MLCFKITSAQIANISGVVKGTDGEPLEGITIGVKENPNQTAISGQNGFYSLTIDAGKPITVVYFNVSFSTLSHTLIAKAG